MVNGVGSRSSKRKREGGEITFLSYHMMSDVGKRKDLEINNYTSTRILTT
jgi:hypothetical protein